MKALKQRVLTNWHFSRFLRLVIGLWMLIFGLQTKDWSIGIFSGLFLFMAVSNSGCCGIQGCAIPQAGSDDSAKNEQTKIINN